MSANQGRERWELEEKHLPKLFEHHGPTGVGPLGAEAESHICSGGAARREER